ncbi:hypothetical protein [Bifidobacterium simiarum]|uniref:hypothetical protein n=1 Tax=Bifidobacterium simiarum TaxID=2045441 RepID=UPI001BDC707F|nr:hypothetical protein [Bifidobacterium simiarum]MBT1166165.1 hypothetical protein [Bifidobacterium simiarum]
MVFIMSLRDGRFVMEMGNRRNQPFRAMIVRHGTIDFPILRFRAIRFGMESDFVGEKHSMPIKNIGIAAIPFYKEN